MDVQIDVSTAGTEVAWRFSKIRQDDGFARMRRRRG
jgi:hypothetical protein